MTETLRQYCSPSQCSYHKGHVTSVTDEAVRGTSNGGRGEGIPQSGEGMRMEQHL